MQFTIKQLINISLSKIDIYEWLKNLTSEDYESLSEAPSVYMKTCFSSLPINRYGSGPNSVRSMICGFAYPLQQKKLTSTFPKLEMVGALVKLALLAVPVFSKYDSVPMRSPTTRSSTPSPERSKKLGAASAPMELIHM